MSVVFSRTGFAPLADALRSLGASRVLILCGPNRRFVDGALAALAAFAPRVFDRAKVHVPIEIVEEARAALGEADAIVALGGGSPIGLGKALRASAVVPTTSTGLEQRTQRDHAIAFAAVPTTYAGSERTSLYGITTGRDKRTQRDPRVVPDIVHYDITLACELPVALTVQSLLNAYAHVASALSTHSLAGAELADATAGAREVIAAADGLIDAPRDLDLRERAARGAAACALAVERGKLGIQHALAHLLGGALGVDHAPLHAILLPHVLAYAPNPALPAVDVIALLRRAGAPTTLAALGADPATVRAALATRPDLPAEIALRAFARA